MSCVRAQVPARRRRDATVRLDEQVDRRSRAEELDRVGTEPTAYRETEALAIEMDSFVQVIDVDVDEPSRRHAPSSNIRDPPLAVRASQARGGRPSLPCSPPPAHTR